VVSSFELEGACGVEQVSLRQAFHQMDSMMLTNLTVLYVPRLSYMALTVLYIPRLSYMAVAVLYFPAVGRPRCGRRSTRWTR